MAVSNGVFSHTALSPEYQSFPKKECAGSAASIERRKSIGFAWIRRGWGACSRCTGREYPEASVWAADVSMNVPLALPAIMLCRTGWLNSKNRYPRKPCIRYGDEWDCQFLVSPESNSHPLERDLCLYAPHSLLILLPRHQVCPNGMCLV